MKDRQPDFGSTRRFAFTRALRLAFPAALLCVCLALPAPAEPTLDELLDLTPPEAPTQTPPDPDPDAASEGEAAATDPADTSDTPDALAQRLAELREKAAQDYKEAANALEEAVQQMDEVSQRLAKSHDASVQTQRVQEQIIQKLDQMIEAAKQQQQQQQQSSSASQPQRPQDSGTSQMQSQSQSPSPGQSGPPQGNEAHQGGYSPGSVGAVGDTQKPIEELKQEWGQLPPRLRDELTEGIGERFSPVYRLMTEAYYRRLAEEAGE